MSASVLNIDLSKLNDVESSKQTIVLLLNQIESFHKEIVALKKENQHLKDEINRLKGEHGKPSILPKTKTSRDISSHKHIKEKKKWQKQPKKKIIKIDNKVYVPINKANLPSDIQFKGYAPIINQDIIFKRNTTKYFIEIWYSPTENKTYRSVLPKESTGYFGNNLRAFCMVMHYAMDISRGKLISFLKSMGIEISDGSLHNILTRDSQQWIRERNDILKAGLNGSYFQSDSTGARVNGQNYYTHVFVSEFFAAFITQPGKSRLDLLYALQGQPKEGLMLQCNQIAIDFLSHYRITEKDLFQIQQLFCQTDKVSKEQFVQITEQHMPELLKKKQLYKWVIESLAFGYFFEQHTIPDILVSDDAKEYSLLAKFHMLCWVHDARYYNKLVPICQVHINELEAFKEKYWGFYRLLKQYQTNPNEKFKTILVSKFDEVFSPTYCYFDLNKQIKRTFSNKNKLLTVLEFPFIPLHNNASELAARKQVRKRDICLHTLTELGTKLQDAFLSIIQTSFLLGVDTYQYILDRINNCSPFYLPDLIIEKINQKQT